MNKIIRNYRNISLPARASLWFLLSSILQNGISIITVPIFTRLLSTSDFGKVSIYQSWLSIITIFATLSLWGGVFNNGMLKYEDDRYRFISSLQGLSTTITISLLMLFLLFSSYITSLLDLPIFLVFIMFMQINFTTAINLWSAKQRYDFKYKKLVAITAVVSFANPLIGLILIHQLQNGGVARIVSIALVQICVGFLIYLVNFKKGKVFFSSEYWKFALAFNIPLIPHYLSQTILNQSDRIMINKFVGTGEAGIYSIAYSVGMILLFVVISVNSTLTPWTYRKLKERDFYSIEKISHTILILIAFLILVLISLIPEIIKIMAPYEYREAIWAAPPIALSIFFIFLYGLFANIEFYFEENKFIMFASTVAALINIILNALLIPIFGYIAAAYTTLFSYIVYSIAHYFFMSKILEKYKITERIFNAKKIILLSIILIGGSIVLVITYHTQIVRYVLLILLGCFIFLKKQEIKKIIGYFRA